MDANTYVVKTEEIPVARPPQVTFTGPMPVTPTFSYSYTSLESTETTWGRTYWQRAQKSLPNLLDPWWERSWSSSTSKDNVPFRTPGSHAPRFLAANRSSPPKCNFRACTKDTNKQADLVASPLHTLVHSPLF